ncbi:FtsX-like permease family protein [Streptomyces sp. NPDC046859]|uniref:ABC transporter permease n=1 Tax=Streptomyces sp. NPDC046859 TaxID=3155734 RepID=UPI0033DB2B54
MNVRQWARDLGMGVRFAFVGGREGWVRALLTAVGVGLGVALLLLTTAVPSMQSVRHERESARADVDYSRLDTKANDHSLLIADVDTDWRDKDIRGRALEREGAKAPLPPGVDSFPAVGEMVVSPALERLLKSDDAAQLRERLPEKIVGTIGESGLIGSQELAFFRGADGLVKAIDGARVARIDRFGDTSPAEVETDPVLVLLVIVVFVVLLMPVAVFIAAAVRFGGERRDRRLAALRLVGSDGRMVRRVAAGEALAGAVLGLVLGTVFFLVGRQVAGSVEVFGISVFPSYLDPSPALALLVGVAVPAAAVVVTLFAMRGVVIEPLGVVRTVKPSRRRLWWRLLMPLGGLAMLWPMIGQGRENGTFNAYLVIGGVLLLLIGVTTLLPWVVEAVVSRLGSGGVAWQLAVRRLQLSSGTAARMVNGVAVAVAGAIALQMLFAGVESDYTKDSDKDVARAQMQVSLSRHGELGPAVERFRDTRGVKEVFAYAQGYMGDRRSEPDIGAELSVGDCASLRQVAVLPSCRDGDAFYVADSEWDQDTPKVAKQPGRTMYLDPSYEGSPRRQEIAWKIPEGMRPAHSREDLTGGERGGFLLTPKALDPSAAPALRGQVYLQLDDTVANVHDLVRNAAVAADPLSYPMNWYATETSKRYATIRTGLFAGAVCVLTLIGASLLVSQLEQLRDRRKLLSALVAFGTRRRTLSLSVLWQTAIPIALGLLLSAVVGVTLGAVLLKMTDTPVVVDWASMLSMTGVGAAVIVVVTLLSLPPLMRLMRPDGLRTE